VHYDASSFLSRPHAHNSSAQSPLKREIGLALLLCFPPHHLAFLLPSISPSLQGVYSISKTCRRRAPLPHPAALLPLQHGTWWLSVRPVHALLGTWQASRSKIVSLSMQVRSTSIRIRVKGSCASPTSIPDWHQAQRLRKSRSQIGINATNPVLSSNRLASSSTTTQSPVPNLSQDSITSHPVLSFNLPRVNTSRDANNPNNAPCNHALGFY